MSEPQHPFYRFFGFLRKFGIPDFISAVAIAEAMYFGWLWVIYLLFGIRVEVSIFFIRDQITMLIMLPFYMRYIRIVEDLESKLSKYFDLESPQSKREIENFYRKLNDLKRNLFLGLLISAYYVFLTTRYLYTGYYRLSFYLYRLVTIIGIIPIGSVIYSTLYITYFLYSKTRNFEVKPDAYLIGIPPTTKIAMMGSILWVLLSLVLLIPSIIRGFSPESLAWYLTFHAFMSFGALLTYFISIFGLHKTMVIHRPKLAGVLHDIIYAKGAISFKDAETGSTKSKMGLKTWPVKPSNIIEFLGILMLLTLVLFLLIFLH